MLLEYHDSSNDGIGHTNKDHSYQHIRILYLCDSVQTALRAPVSALTEACGDSQFQEEKLVHKGFSVFHINHMIALVFQAELRS